MMKRLFWVFLIGATFAIGGSAMAEDLQQTWVIKFPKFLYAWINTDEVVFDLSSSATSGGGNLVGVAVGSETYQLANQTNFGNCIGADYSTETFSSNESLTGVVSSPSAPSTANCAFAPTQLNDTSGANYTVTYNTDSITGADADTDLLVASLGIGSWQVETISADSDGIPAGLRLQFFPAAVKSGSLVDPRSDSVDPASAKVELKSSNTSDNANWTGDTLGYYIDGYYFLYAMPVVHGLIVDPASLDYNAFDDTSLSPITESVTITYTISSL